MQKLPIADPKEPRIEMAPEEPFSTALNENTSLGLDFEKKPYFRCPGISGSC